MKYRGIHGTYELESQPMKQGGEGAIYRIQNRDNLLAKLYHQEKLSPELEEKIIYMMDNPPDKSVMDQIAWPQDILRNVNDEFIGFIMPKLSIDVDLKAIYTYPPNPQIPINYENRVVVATNICIVISAIHKMGYVFGDFNPLNIGVNLTTGHVAFLDTDSYHIENTSNGKVYRCGVGLNGYIAPELIRRCKSTDFLNAPLPTFTQETDRFALAIHIFKLLMNGYTPFNGIKEGESASQASPGLGNEAIEKDNYCFKPGNKPQSVATPDINCLSMDLQHLFKKTFIGGSTDPQKRATADEWFDALLDYRKNLVACQDNPNHFYYAKARKCPYCEADENYKQSMATPSRTYSGTSQINFSQPVGVPPKAKSQKKPKRKSGNKWFGKTLLWIFFFPIMLIITICKQKMGPFKKFIAIYLSLSLSMSLYISLVGGAIAVIGSMLNGIDNIFDFELGTVTEGNYQYIPEASGYSVQVAPKKENSLSGKVEIPSEYKGKPITEIPANAFENCVNVTSFIIPDSVVEIGEAAFKGCTNLQSITLPFVGGSENAEYEKSVFGYIFGYEDVEQEMDDEPGEKTVYNEKPSEIVGQTWQLSFQEHWDEIRHQFYYYIPDSITSVTITKQTNIPAYAFNGCKNLTEIKYTSQIAQNSAIGEAAFQDCTNLKFDGENNGYLEIPNGIICIGAYAYSGCLNITELIVPNTVRDIGEAAFKGCANLQSITLPFVGKSETAEYEESVFGYIFGYEDVEQEMDDEPGEKTVYNEKPSEIVGQTWQLSFQERWDEIRHQFYYYIPDSITSVTITKQKTIPAYAFNGCKNLTDIKYAVPLSQNSIIGIAAFQDCTNLKFDGENNGHLEIPNGVIGIGAYAYSGCLNITELIVPNTVREIGVSAFKGCTNIQNVTLPFVGKSENAEYQESVFGYIFGYECIEIEMNNRPSVDTVYNDKPNEIVGETWQLSLQENYDYTRQRYYYYIPYSITSVTITKQTNIPAYAFNGCKKITSITLLEGSKFGSYALQSCKAKIYYSSK